jgi:histidyl-tRNA synthetase
LRYDLTVPLARVIAEHRGRLPRFFKRYQIQPVWRADRPARGRFREFYQCDVDVVGSRSTVVETELCAAVSDVLDRLGFREFTLRLNHRGLLRGVLDTAGVPDDLHDDALVALDKLDKIGPDRVGAELEARGVPDAARHRLMDAFREHGGEADDPARRNAAVLEWARGLLATHTEGTRAVTELEEITSLCARTPAGARVRVDPTLARGLSYYTGAIMEVAVPDLAGSLGGGGRYDGLIGMFLGEDIPACGFSLGLERILVVMTERNMFPPHVRSAAADVLVTLFDGASVTDALALARDLRTAGLRVEVYPDTDKLGKQFKYAAAAGVPRVAVLGTDERERGVVTIKNMTTGQQTVVARNDVAAQLSAELGEGRSGPPPDTLLPDD